MDPFLGAAGSFAFGFAFGSAVKRIRRYRRTIRSGHNRGTAQCAPSKEEQLEERFKKIDGVYNALADDVGVFAKIQKENLVEFRDWRDAFRRHLEARWDALEKRVNSQDQKLDEAICRYREGSDAETAWKKELEIKCTDLQVGFSNADDKINKMQDCIDAERSASIFRVNEVRADAGAEVKKLFEVTAQLQGKLSYLEQIIFSAAELVGYPAATDPNGADSAGANLAPAGSAPVGSAPLGSAPVGSAPVGPSGAGFAAMTPLQARQEFLRRRSSGFGPNPGNAL